MNKNDERKLLRYVFSDVRGQDDLIEAISALHWTRLRYLPKMKRVFEAVSQIIILEWTDHRGQRSHIGSS